VPRRCLSIDSRQRCEINDERGVFSNSVDERISFVAGFADEIDRDVENAAILNDSCTHFVCSSVYAFSNFGINRTLLNDGAPDIFAIGH